MGIIWVCYPAKMEHFQILLSLLFVFVFSTGKGYGSGMTAIFEVNKRASKERPDSLFTKTGDVAPDEDDDDNDDQASFGMYEEEEVKLFEGDIVFSKEIEHMMRRGATSKYDAEFNKQWTDRTVPYTIDQQYHGRRI